MTKIEELTAAVQAENTVIDSAITLLNGFAQRLADGISAAQAGDMAALEALKTDVDSHKDALAAAVASVPA